MAFARTVALVADRFLGRTLIDLSLSRIGGKDFEMSMCRLYVRQRAATAVVFAVALLWQGTECWGDDSQIQRLNDWVSTTYRPANARLVAPLVNVKATGRIEKHRLDDGCMYKADSVHYERGGAGVVVLNFTYHHPSVKRPDNAVVRCATDKYMFNLARGAASEPFVVEKYDDQESSLAASRVSTSLIHSRYVRAATEMNGVPVLELLADPVFRCTKFVGATIADDECYVLDFELANSKMLPNYLGGQITFSGSFDWAVREYTIRRRVPQSGTTSVSTGTIAYKKWNTDGTVFPTRIRSADRTEVSNPPKEYEVAHTVEFLSVKRDVVRDEQFTLSAYGLPEFGQPQRSYYPLDNWVFWLCIAVVVATTLGLRRYRKTMQHA